MAPKPGGYADPNTQSVGGVSPEEREAAARGTIARAPVLPSEGLLPQAIPQATPQQPVQQPTAAATEPQDGESWMDAELRAMDAAGPRVGRGQPVDLPDLGLPQREPDSQNFQDPRALAIPNPRGLLSPEASEITDLPIVQSTTGLAGLDSDGVLKKDEELLSDVNVLEDNEQRRKRYEEEQTRQRPMTKEEILDSIYDNDSGTEREFESVAQQLALTWDREVEATPRAGEALMRAGIIDQNTGKVNDVAVKTALFTLAAAAAKSTDQSSKAVLQAQGELAAGTITEKELNTTLRDQILRPDFDRQSLQSSFAKEFESLYLGDVDEAVDAEGRVVKQGLGQSKLSPVDQSMLAITMVNAMEDANFLMPVMREQDGKKRAGYMVTDTFYEMLRSGGMGYVIDKYAESKRVGVTFTPNILGAPSGQLSVAHKSLTRSPKTQRIERDSEVGEGLTAMGTTGNGIGLTSFGMNIVMLESIFTKMDPSGYFSTHPFAESFRMGFPSFAKHLKDPDVSTPELMATKLAGLKEKAETSFGPELEANTAILTAYNERIRLAGHVAQLVADSYIKALPDAAKLNGRTFFYTYAVIAGTSRIMVNGSELNYHANKKARALVANPREWLVDPNKRSSESNRAFRIAVARNLNTKRKIDDVVLKTEDAANFDVVLDDFDKFIDIGNNSAGVANNPAGAANRAAAIWAANNLSPDRNAINSWASQTSAHVQGRDVQIKPNHVYPGRDEKAPKLEQTINLDDQMSYTVAQLVGAVDSNNEQQRSDDIDSKLIALIELGKYLKGNQFLTQLTAEADGASNGLALQAYQLGIDNLAKRTGILVNGNDFISPDGNVRDLIQGVIATTELTGESAITATFTDPKVRKKWESLYAEFIERREKVKALHKLPVMTTIYGKDPDYHQDSIRDFLESEPALAKDFAAQAGTTQSELIDIMRKIEGAALKLGLGGALDHGFIIKNAHNAALAGGELFTVIGPNGWESVSGGIEYQNVGDETVTFADGRTYRITTTKPVGSPYTAKKPIPGKTPVMGSKGRNQVAVSSTLIQDATIAQRGFVEAKRRVGDDFWGIQVFDAIKGDVKSFEIFTDTMNQEFEEINKPVSHRKSGKAWSMVGAELEALQTLKTKVRDKVATAEREGRTFDVSRDGEYKGMFNLLNSLESKAEDAGSEKYGTKTSWRGRRRDAKAAYRGDIGFDITGGTMTPKQFLKAFEHVLTTLQIEVQLKQYKRKTDEDHQMLLKNIKQQKGSINNYG